MDNVVRGVFVDADSPSDVEIDERSGPPYLDRREKPASPDTVVAFMRACHRYKHGVMERSEYAALPPQDRGMMGESRWWGWWGLGLIVAGGLVVAAAWAYGYINAPVVP